MSDLEEGFFLFPFFFPSFLKASFGDSRKWEMAELSTPERSPVVPNESSMERQQLTQKFLGHLSRTWQPMIQLYAMRGTSHLLHVEGVLVGWMGALKEVQDRA